jgi:hypothetical protein
MARPTRLLSFTLCLSALAPSVSAQQTTAPTPPKPGAKKTAAEVDPMAEVRRASAISLVSSLADEARTFRDSVTGARVQARAADALWDTDAERARALFRRAWEAAEAADRENERLTDAERRERAAARGSTGGRDVPSLRREVLGLAAKRDRALGEEFLAKLDEARKQESEATGGDAPVAQTPEQRIDPDNPPPAMSQRLGLAQQILEAGDADRAVQFADPALYPVNTFGMLFLNTLREKNKPAADQRFLALVSRAGGDPASDANTVSLLASYVFTPFLYVTARPDGNSHTRRRRADNSPPADLDPRLREAYLRTAAQILLRPLLPAGQDRTSSGRIGAYVVTTRLLPLFERFAPDETAALRARQSALAQDTPEQNRRPDDPLLTRGIVPEDPSRDKVQDFLNRADAAKNSNERDELYFQAAMSATDADRARELAEKIEDVDTRRQLIAYLAFQQVENAVRQKKPEEALRLAHADELNAVQRAWAFTEAARLLAKSQPAKAVEALEEALKEAREHIDEKSPDRVRALVAVATQFAALDRQRAWELMNDVVKAANALADFSGEGGELTARVEFKSGGAMTQNFGVESFDLAGVFDALAREDFDRAAGLARALKGESARSVATLAVARSALSKRADRAAN